MPLVSPDKISRSNLGPCYFIYVLIKGKWRWACTSYGGSFKDTKQKASDFFLIYYGGATGVRVTKRKLKGARHG